MNTAKSKVKESKEPHQTRQFLTYSRELSGMSRRVTHQILTSALTSMWRETIVAQTPRISNDVVHNGVGSLSSSRILSRPA